MKIRSLLLSCAVLAAACFLPPVREPVRPEVRRIDPGGADAPCPRGEAHVEMPSRERPTPLAPLHDLAYAAAEAGPEGCVWLLGAAVALAVLRGLWSQGIRGAFRRGLLAASLGAPMCLALLYASCFLDGRTIRLGPDLADYVPASLHVHTDVSTGLLSPKDVVIWHAKRGFRVLNVTDKNSIQGGVRAREAVRDLGPLTPPLVVTVGDEWHTNPDIVFVNVTQEPPAIPPPAKEPREHEERLRRLAQVAAAVHAEGGALFLAHPWSKVPGEMSLEQIFDAGLDGVEVVNGVIHGGDGRTRAAVAAGKSLFGVIDYKFGPHVTAITLLDAQLARTPRGVADAVRDGKKLVLYAIPGGHRSAAEWKAARVGLRGAIDGLDSLREAPRARRAIWFAWGALSLVLWWITTRGDKGLGLAASRTLFVGCAVAELALLLFLWDRVRVAVGTVPVPLLLIGAAVLSVPLLVASHSLALLERRR